MSAQWNYLLKTQPPADPEPAPRPRRRWLRSAIALLVLLIAVGGYGALRGGDPARVQQLRKDLFASKNLTPEQQKALGQELRQEMAKLSPAQRSELFIAGQKEMIARIDRYFAMSPAERRQHLDRDIDRTEQWRKEAANRPPRTGTGSPKTFGSGNRSAEEVERRRKARLANTTPEQRATMDQLWARMDKYRQELNARRAQRGLPPMSGPGRR